MIEHTQSPPAIRHDASTHSGVAAAAAALSLLRLMLGAGLGWAGPVDDVVMGRRRSRRQGPRRVGDYLAGRDTAKELHSITSFPIPHLKPNS